MGRWRWNSGFVLILVVARLYAAGSFALADPPTGGLSFLPSKTTFESPRGAVPLGFLDDRPIVAVNINGASAIRMLLDSSAQTIVVDDRVVRDSGLTTVGPLEKSALFPAGAESADLVRIDSLSIANVRFRKFNAIAVDLDALGHGRRRYDGVLPLSFFSGVLVTLDYPGNEFVIQRGEVAPSDGETVFDYTLNHGAPVIKLALAGVTFDAAITTANQMACTFPPSRKETVVKAYGQAPREKTMGPVKRIDDFAAGRLQIGRHEVSYAPFEIKEGIPSIGGIILRNFSITFDQENKRVWFDRNERTPILFSFLPKYGFQLERHHNKMSVLAVFPDSPIDESYIRVGHEIAMIERRRILDYTPGALRALMERSDSLHFKVKDEGVALQLVVRGAPR